MILFCVLAYICCYYVYKSGTESYSLDQTPEQQSIMITNLPLINTEILSSSLNKWFNTKYPNGIIDVYVVPNWSKAHKFYKEYLKDSERNFSLLHFVFSVYFLDYFFVFHHFNLKM